MFGQGEHNTPETHYRKHWLRDSLSVSPKPMGRVNQHTYIKTFLFIAFGLILALLIYNSPFIAARMRQYRVEQLNLSSANLVAVPPSPILIGAGDISSCGNNNDSKTAQLISTVFASGSTGKVFDAGDNAYESGSGAEFANCYQPTWGTFKNRTFPAVGNHEYLTPSASGYFNYFGSSAGDPTRGYYSYNLGSWHIVVINSNCSKVGGCQTESQQEKWLRADLAANSQACTLAYWHHPRFSSGQLGNYTSMGAIWQTLYDFNAEVVIVGHDHDYERFAPQNPSGEKDLQRGIREFVVGTGGKDHTSFSTIKPNSEVRNSNTFGVLKLTLNPNSYTWMFIPEAGKTFTDSGTTTCH